MEVLVAKSGGFCRGVKKAVDTAFSVDPENTYIFGEIIHNKEVVDAITKRGIVTAESLSEVPDGATLIIRSHGAGKAVYDECAARAEAGIYRLRHLACELFLQLEPLCEHLDGAREL